MKKFLVVLLSLVMTVSTFAQDFSEVKVPGIYYIQDSSFVNIEPVNYRNIKMNGVFVKTMVYEYAGKNAKVSFNQSTLELYICLNPYAGQTIANFVVSKFDTKKKTRELEWFSASMFGTSHKDNAIDYTYEKISEYQYKITIMNLKKGNYCIFYNYGGSMANKVYDFDIYGGK